MVKKYCHGRCKTRINAILLNESYQNKLQELMLSLMRLNYSAVFWRTRI